MGAYKDAGMYRNGQIELVLEKLLVEIAKTVGTRLRLVRKEMRIFPRFHKFHANWTQSLLVLVVFAERRSGAVVNDNRVYRLRRRWKLALLFWRWLSFIGFVAQVNYIGATAVDDDFIVQRRHRCY